MLRLQWRRQVQQVNPRRGLPTFERIEYGIVRWRSCCFWRPSSQTERALMESPERERAMNNSTQQFLFDLIEKYIWIFLIKFPEITLIYLPSVELIFKGTNNVTLVCKTFWSWMVSPSLSSRNVWLYLSIYEVKLNTITEILVFEMLSTTCRQKTLFLYECKGEDSCPLLPRALESRSVFVK